MSDRSRLRPAGVGVTPVTAGSDDLSRPDLKARAERSAEEAARLGLSMTAGPAVTN